jgi:hypothetical protein
LRRTLIPLAMIAGLILPASAAAGTSAGGSATAHGGGLVATVTYSGKIPNFHDMHLKIVKHHRTLYSGAIRDKACGSRCWPLSGTGQPTVRLANLDRTGVDDVLLNLYTGGAHCCSVLQVFRPSAAMNGRYVLATRYDFGDPGYRLQWLGGAPRFVTADDSFAYAFTDYAASGMPVKVLALKGVRFVDVTAKYPALVRSDAAKWMKAYRKQASSHYQDSVGVMAAWVADEANLGRYSQAIAYAKAQAKAGHLHSGLGRNMGGKRFVAALQKLLKRDGYPVS